MRVVLLVNSAARMGGVEHVAQKLQFGFQDAGHSARLLSLWGEGEPPGQLLPRYVSAVSSLTARERVGRLLPFDPVSAIAHRDPLARRLAAKRLRTLVPDEADVALLATSALTAQVLAQASYTRAATVAQNHTSFEAMASGRDLAAVRGAGRHLDRVLMLSRGDWEALSACASELRGGWMRNPAPALHDSSERDRAKTIVSLGRYEPPKDFGLLVRAWALIASQVPGWRLDLYGDGSQGPLLRRLVDELGVADVVAVNGPTEAAGRILSKASLLALASRSEGMPLVMLEAFAAGTPVVASRCSPGVEELVCEGQTGWLVPPNDIEAFAATLLQAITDEKERDLRSQRARSSVGHFSTAAVVDDWLALFAEIQAQHAGRRDPRGG